MPEAAAITSFTCAWMLAAHCFAFAAAARAAACACSARARAASAAAKAASMSGISGRATGRSPMAGRLGMNEAPAWAAPDADAEAAVSVPNSAPAVSCVSFPEGRAPLSTTPVASPVAASTVARILPIIPPKKPLSIF
jgi:hypothetical protein